MFLLAACPPGGEFQPTRCEPPQDIGLEDWCTMLGAVKDRLRQIGGPGAPADPRAGVLECAAALELLHMSLPWSPALAPVDPRLLERLGKALVGEWNQLPTALQRALYGRAVASDAPGADAALRHHVARLLHDHNDRRDTT